MKINKIPNLGLKKFLFEKINRKLFTVLLFVLILMISMVILTLNLNNKIAEDVNLIRESTKEISFYEERILINIDKINLLNNYFLFSAIIGGILSILIISKSIIKPINELEQAARQMEKGKFDVRVNIKTGDELEELGKAFNKTAETLSQAEKEKKEIDKAKTELLSITSHELRSPMTPIKAHLELFTKGYFGKLNSKQKDAIELLLRNTQKLDDIIVDFLEISRIEAARLKFYPIKANLKGYILEEVKELKNFMPEKKIKIITKISNLPIIKVDPNRIIQVLKNLIINAKKFSLPNTQITVEAQLKDHMIQISVKDNGIGLSQEDQRRIFNPFFQAEQTIYRQHGGTGLGLPICRGIVEMQNGKIWVESEMDKGSTFYFTVPLKPTKKIKSVRFLLSSQENFQEKDLPRKDKEAAQDSVTIYDLIKENLSKERKGLEFKNKLMGLFRRRKN